MVYVLFEKKASDGAIAMPQNEQLPEELHKPIIRKFKKRRMYSAFKDNIWGAELSDMQLISKSTSHMSNGKDIIIRLIAALIKRT